MNKAQVGSRTAKGGFALEKEVVGKFTDWKNDEDARNWLKEMGVESSKIQSLFAQQIPTRLAKKDCVEWGIDPADFNNVCKHKKADAQVRVEIILRNARLIFNISIKKVSQTVGFNQIDRRPVSTYKGMWNFDNDVEYWLKAYTGAIGPTNIPVINARMLKDSRRLLMNEMPETKKLKIINFFTRNKALIISDILRGRGCFSAEWMIVGREIDGEIEWVIKPMSIVINHFCQGEVGVSSRGSLHIGKITVQRKGGTPDPTSLQFKLNPGELFNV